MANEFLNNFFEDCRCMCCADDLKRKVAMIPIGVINFTDGEASRNTDKQEMKTCEQHKEDTEMKRSTEMEKLIENIADARIDILIGSQSEFTLFRSIKKLRSVAQDAVNSEMFSEEKILLMDLLEKIHDLMMRDITRDTFGKYLDNLLNSLGVKLKILKEEEEKEVFKNKILENIDLLYKVYTNLNQE